MKAHLQNISNLKNTINRATSRSEAKVHINPDCGIQSTRQVLWVIIRSMALHMGQVVERCTIGAGQAKIIKLTITLKNFITLEDQLIPFM